MPKTQHVVEKKVFDGAYRTMQKKPKTKKPPMTTAKTYVAVFENNRHALDKSRLGRIEPSRKEITVPRRITRTTPKPPKPKKAAWERKKLKFT